ncbi:TEC1 family protein [Abortiporus biennis]
MNPQSNDTTLRNGDAHSQSSTSTSPIETGSAVQTILTGRKCWRIMKGKDEAVWPPQLEAALIEGLEKYRPTESRSTRALGRFPMRNKFISDYIFETTGKRRTPKQVGSRIQQLRDTSSGKQILKALSDRHYEMMRPARAVEPPQLSAVDDDSTSLQAATGPPAPSHVYIEALPPRASDTYSMQQGYQPSSSLAMDDFRALGPRPLANVDNTLTFVSSIRTPCYSSFHVLKNDILVHSEITTMEECTAEVQQPISSSNTFLYRTTLVPTFWSQLCESEDLSSFTISQEIFRISDEPSSSAQSNVISSVVYHFTVTSLSPRSLSPTSVSIDDSFPDLEYQSYNSASPSPSLASDLDSYLMLGIMDENFAPNAHGMVNDIPDLIHHGEDGYNSYPDSPTDSVSLIPAHIPWQFPTVKNANMFHVPSDISDGYFPVTTTMAPRSFDGNVIPDFLL